MRWPFGSRKQIAWSFAVIVLRMVVMGVALFGVLRPLLTRGEDLRSGRPVELVEHLVLTLLAAAFAYVFLGIVARASWADLGFSRAKLGKNLALGVATFAVGAVYVLVRLRAEGELGESMATFSAYTLGQRIEMSLVGVHVIFGEEMLFRGYLQPGLRARFSAPVAIGITALVFAAYHVEFAPGAFLGHVFWGILWGTVREKTKSTLPSSVAHFLNWAFIGWI
jgi:membrane protease YdiL (CAAX protease family)